MKYKRLKNYLKLGILLFGTAFFLTTCEKDNFNEEKTLEHSDNEVPIVIKSINITEVGETFNNLKYKYQLESHFGIQQSANTQFRVASESDNSTNIVIYTDEVKEITHGNYTSYTMKIASLDDDPNTFYNITIEDNNGTEGMFITKYTPTESWLSNQNESFEGDIQTKRIDDVQIPVDQLEDPAPDDGGGNTQYPDDCDGSVIATTVLTPFNCGCGHSPTSAGHNYVTGCTSGSPAHPGYENVTTYECIPAVVGNPPDGSDPSTGNPNTGGPGGGNPGGGSGATNTNNLSLTSPVGKEEGAVYGPCNKINDIFEDYPQFRQKLINLSTTVNQDHENAIGIHKDGTEFAASGTNLYPFVKLDENPNSKYMVIAHTHYETSTTSPQTDTYSIFSLGDLQFFAQRLRENELKVTKFVAFLITGKGTRYALTIDNTAKFLHFFKYVEINRKWRNGEATTQEETNFVINTVVPLQKKYFDKETPPKAPIKKENTNNQEVLEAFLEFMDEADLGISLFRIDENFLTFTKLEYDNSESNNTKEEVCN